MNLYRICGRLQPLLEYHTHQMQESGLQGGRKKARIVSVPEIQTCSVSGKIRAANIEDLAPGEDQQGGGSPKRREADLQLQRYETPFGRRPPFGWVCALGKERAG